MLGFSYMLLLAAIILLIIFFYFVPFLLWISARASGVKISVLQLFLMRIRKVPPQIIVRAMIEAHKAGLQNITRDDLEAWSPPPKPISTSDSRWQRQSTSPGAMYSKPYRCR